MNKIKKLIFDLDNTLILWKNEYREAIKKTVEYYKLDINYIDIDDVIESYEKYYNVYKKENMLELINKKFALDLKIDFIDMWLNELGSMSEYNEEVNKTLEYLNSKYKLVVLTNWFKDSQEARLKYAGMNKYFSEIIGGDNCIKPSLESYQTAIGNNSIDECIMIGDSYQIDLEYAQKMGMKIIQVDLKNKINETKEYPVIKSIIELKDML